MVADLLTLLLFIQTSQQFIAMLDLGGGALTRPYPSFGESYCCSNIEQRIADLGVTEGGFRDVHFIGNDETLGKSLVLVITKLFPKSLL